MHTQRTRSFSETTFEQWPVYMPGVAIVMLNKVVLQKLVGTPDGFIPVTRQVAIFDEAIPDSKLPKDTVCRWRKALAIGKPCPSATWSLG